MAKELESQFEEAFIRISETEESIPIDVVLRLYAYYKQAKKGDNFTFENNESEQDLRNAFKFNAWIQLKGMSSREAKQEYVNLVNKVLK